MEIREERIFATHDGEYHEHTRGSQINVLWRPTVSTSLSNPFLKKITDAKYRKGEQLQDDVESLDFCTQAEKGTF